jgi:hypothetical protein
MVRDFYCCCGVGRVCPQFVHYPPQRHSFSIIRVHRTSIIMRLLADKNLITELNQSINENICVI